MKRERQRLESAIARLRKLRAGLSRANQAAIDVAIEHIESRLIDMRTRTDAAATRPIADDGRKISE